MDKRFVNMTKILFVQTPPWGTTTFPIGIAYLVGYMQALGYDTHAYDANIQLYHRLPSRIRLRWENDQFDYWASGEVLKKYKTEINSMVEDIIAYEADIIGFSIAFTSIPILNVLLEKLRSSTKATIIVGGGGTSYSVHRAFLRKDLIDYAIIGEGEYALKELLKCDFSDEFRQEKGGIDSRINKCENVPSLEIWKDVEEDHMWCVRSIEVVDVNALPYPVYDGFEIALYTEKDLLPIVLSRGCINACHFCCDWGLKKPYRPRIPENVVSEIESLREKYNRDRFEFCDLLINGDVQQLERFCDLLILRGLPIHWGGQAAVRKEMDRDLFIKLKQAGCGGLAFGFESFSQSLLRKMNKRFSLADAAHNIKDAHDAGIIIEGNLLVGFPGETDNDIDATISFIKEHRDVIDSINSLNICSVGPGMPIWDNAESFEIDKAEVKDWYAWHTKGRENTLEVRMQRHQRLQEFIVQEKLDPKWLNVRKDPQKEPDSVKPNSCIILLTLNCNLKCAMCRLWTNKEDASERPSIAEWKQMLDDLAQYAAQPFTVVFGGGEPLLQRDTLVDLIAYAKTKGFRTSLATSGYELNRDTIERLAEAGLDYIALTLYSLREKTQKKLRGVPYSGKRVKQAIALIDRFAPQIEIAIDTVLMEPNRRDIIKLTKWVLRDKRISKMMFQAIMQPFHTKPDHTWYKKEDAFLWPQKEDAMIKVIEKIMQLKKKAEKVGIQKIHNSFEQFHVFKNYFRYPEKFIKKNLCPTYNNGHFGVMPDGSVRLCPYKEAIGNIKNGSIREIWHSEEARESRAQIKLCTDNCHHIVNCWYEEE